jgi:hypothetical protein
MNYRKISKEEFIERMMKDQAERKIKAMDAVRELEVELQEVSISQILKEMGVSERDLINR